MPDILLDVKIQGTQDVVKAERALVKVQNSAKRLASEMEKGRMTTQAYFKGQTQLVQVLTKAGFSYKEARDAVFQYTKAIRASEVAIGRAGVQYQRSAKGINKFGVLTQQAGYQVGDFFVQLQSGTNAFVAFGQQATQVAGTLTLLGGKWIFLGTALGIAIPLLTALGAAFMRTRSEAEDAAEGVKTLDDRLQSLDKTLQEYLRTREAAREGITAEELLGLEGLEEAAARYRSEIEDIRDFFGAQLPGMEVSDEFLRPLLAESEKYVAALEKLIEAENRLATLRRQQGEEQFREFSERLTQYREEIALSREILQSGQDSAEVRRLVREQALAAELRRIEALRQSEEITDAQAVALSRAAEQASQITAEVEESEEAQASLLNLVKMTKDAYAAVAAEQERIAAAAEESFERQLQALREQRTIQEAILRFGEDSAEVALVRARLAYEAMGISGEELQILMDHVAASEEIRRNYEEQQARAEETKDAIAEIAGMDLPITDRILALAGALGIAVDEARDLAYEINAFSTSGIIGLLGQLSGEELLPPKVYTGTRPQARPDDIDLGYNPPTGAGTGGGATGYTGIFPELQAQVEAAMKQTAAYQEEIKLLDFALDKGMITQEGYNRAVAEAQEYYNQAADAASNYEEVLLTMANTASSAIGDAMMSIVDGTKSAKDAFSDMAQVILKKAFELAVINPILNSIFGGIPGFNMLPSIVPSVNANGNVFSGGNVQAFATGGVVGSPTFFPMANGGVGLMGEAGPEAIMPLKRGKGGRLGVEVSGEQGNVVINQTFAFQANGDESVKRIIASEAPKIAALTQKQMLDARRRGGVVRDTFA